MFSQTPKLRGAFHPTQGKAAAAFSIVLLADTCKGKSSIRSNAFHYQADYIGFWAWILVTICWGLVINGSTGKQKYTLAFIGTAIRVVWALLQKPNLPFTFALCLAKVALVHFFGDWNVIGSVLALYISVDVTLLVQPSLEFLVNLLAKEIRRDVEGSVLYTHPPLDTFGIVAIAFSTSCVAFSLSAYFQGFKVAAVASAIIFGVMKLVSDSGAAGEKERNYIDDLILIQRVRTEARIKQEFEREVKTKSEGLPYSRFPRFVESLTMELNVSSEIFHNNDLAVWFDRFDYNGDGHLDLAEIVRLCCRVLREYRVHNYGTYEYVAVPISSLEEQYLVKEKKLGEGGQGSAYLCNCTRDGTVKQFAVKIYDKTNSNAGDLDSTKAEFALMKKVSENSAFLAKTHMVFQDATMMYIVNEAYTGGDLTRLNENARAKAGTQSRVLTENWWRDVFFQCLRGVRVLHEHSIVHCDIKEANIMVKSIDYDNIEIVLIDFGLARASGGDKAKDGMCGTLLYMPPEVVGPNPAWYPSGDIWSLAVVMFQLLANRSDWYLMCPSPATSTHEDVMRTIQRDHRPWDLLNEHPSAQTLLRSMLKIPHTARTSSLEDARFSVVRCLEHYWFKNIKKGEYPDLK